MSVNVHKNDQIIVLSGDERGKKGKVLRVLPERGKVLVEGLNYVWKHMRKSNQHPKGARIQKEAALDISNIRVICQSCDKPTRIGMKFLASGEKIRVCRHCKEVIVPKENIKA